MFKVLHLNDNASVNLEQLYTVRKVLTCITHFLLQIVPSPTDMFCGIFQFVYSTFMEMANTP